MLRAIRPYALHQDKFDDAVVASIEELTRASDHQTALLGELTRKQHRPTEREDELAPLRVRGCGSDRPAPRMPSRLRGFTPTDAGDRSRS
jgi:hypothetical protein